MAGVASLPIPVSVAATSVIVSHVVKHRGVRPFLTGGPILVRGGLLRVPLVNTSSSHADVLGTLGLVGIGMGLSFEPLTWSGIPSV